MRSRVAPDRRGADRTREIAERLQLSRGQRVQRRDPFVEHRVAHIGDLRFHHVARADDAFFRQKHERVALRVAAPEELYEEARVVAMNFSEKLQAYATQTGFLAISVPDLPLPAGTAPWGIDAALTIQRFVLKRLHELPVTVRRREDVRALRQSLGYTLSVVTAATPEQGFALMRDCASWNDTDINWILRENLKKKRLAKFVEHTEKVSKLLAKR